MTVSCNERRDTLGSESHCDMVLKQFGGLTRAVIDASSIIYMEKTGFLDELAATLLLYVPEEIYQETGIPGLPGHVINTQKAPCPNDDILLTAARQRCWPVISEDRKVLVKARQYGLPHFNALMMLHFLLFKKKIDRKRHRKLREKLVAFAWYSDHVIDVSEAVYRSICKKTQGKGEIPCPVISDI